METTYRLVSLENKGVVGHTAASPELAKLVPGEIQEGEERLGIERTDWIEQFDKMKIHRSILIDAESKAGDWKIGPNAPYSSTVDDFE